MKNKSEIQIVNEKVSDAIKSLTQKKKKQDEIIESIQRNQGHFYHWQNIEKLINGIGLCLVSTNSFTH